MISPNGTELDHNKAYPLFCKLFDDLKESKTKVGKKVYELLNEEQFNVLLDGNKFYFEVGVYGKLPNYAYDFLLRYIPRNYGYTYAFKEA